MGVQASAIHPVSITNEFPMQNATSLGLNLSFKFIVDNQQYWLALYKHNSELVWSFSKQDLRIIQYLLGVLLLSYWPMFLLAILTNKQQKTKHLLGFLIITSLLYLSVIDWLIFNIAGALFLWSGSLLLVISLIYFIIFQNQFITGYKTGTELIIAYASQSGTAAQLAKRFSQSLTTPCHNVDLAQALPHDLLSYQQALFIVSTYGEGEPPESVRPFFNKLKKSSTGLTHLNYAVLALGDQQYPQFCAFGHALDLQLQELGAQTLQPLQEVDQEQPTTIKYWWQQITTQLKLRTKLAEKQWQKAEVITNKQLNPLTPERPAHHISLKVDHGHYNAGDLLEVLAEGTQTPRTYSIASASYTDRVELLVRKVIKDNGETGVASGYLSGLIPGQMLNVAFRQHPHFHLPDKDVPLILIGAGTGLAPFMAFLQQRARDKNVSPCWLFMGERVPSQDNYFSAQLDEFQQQKILTERFHAWSRNGQESGYITDILQQQADAIRDLVLAQEALVYICGNAAGFGKSVLSTLEDIFAHHWLQTSVQHKIKKDLY